MFKIHISTENRYIFFSLESDADIWIAQMLSTNQYPNAVFTKTDITEEIVNAALIKENEDYLKFTDWYAIRQADTGQAIPPQIQEARQLARITISNLRNA